MGLIAHFSSPFSSNVGVCGPRQVTLPITITEALKWLSSQPLFLVITVYIPLPPPPPPGICIPASTSPKTTGHDTSLTNNYSIICRAVLLQCRFKKISDRVENATVTKQLCLQSCNCSKQFQGLHSLQSCLFNAVSRAPQSAELFVQCSFKGSTVCRAVFVQCSFKGPTKC